VSSATAASGAARRYGSRICANDAAAGGPTCAEPSGLEATDPPVQDVGVRRVVIIIGLLVGAVFTYVAVADADLPEAWRAFARSDERWLAAGLGVLGGAFLLRALRWQAMYASGRRPPLGAVTRSLFLGYLLNIVLPARAGEAARVIALNRLTPTSLAEAAATASLERVFDVLSLLLLLFLALPWLPELAWIRAAAVVAALLLLALLVASAAVHRFGERPLEWAVRQVARVPWIPAHRFADAPANLLHGLAGIRSPATAALAFAWTTASWLVIGIAFWLVTIAFDLGLSPLAGLLVVIGVGVAMILPAPPAAVGVFEGATVVVLAASGVPESDALSCAVVLHALTVVPFLVLALPVLRLRWRPGTPRHARTAPGPKPGKRDDEAVPSR